MTDLEKFEKLAKLKAEIKELTAAAKELQSAILNEPDCPKKVKTGYGVLSLTTRPSYELTSKQGLIDEITLKNYIEASTITLPAVRKVCGTAVADLLTPDLFIEKSVSRYFTLRRK